MIRKKNTLRIALTITLVTIILTMNLAIFHIYGAYPSEPHDANAMWIEPSSILFSTEDYGIGDIFTVTVWVNITSVLSTEQVVGVWQFYMIYDKSIMEVTDVKYTNESVGKSQFFEDINTWPGSPAYGTHNATHDYTMFGEMWNPMALEPNPKKSIPAYGSLATVTFNITTVPPEGEIIASIIDISTKYPDKTFVADNEANKVPFTLCNADYIISEFSSSILAMAIILTFIAGFIAVKLQKSKVQ